MTKIGLSRNRPPPRFGGRRATGVHASAAHLTIGVDDSMEDLYRSVRGQGAGHPCRRRRGDRQVPPWPAPSARRDRPIRAGSLGDPGPHGDVSVVADLEGLELRDLEISAGASQVEVRLPRPKDEARVRIGGRSERRRADPAGRCARSRPRRGWSVEAGHRRLQTRIRQREDGLAQPGLRPGRRPVRRRDRRRSQQGHHTNLMSHGGDIVRGWRRPDDRQSSELRMAMEGVKLLSYVRSRLERT